MSQVTNISIAIWPEGVGSLWEDDFIAALARMGVSLDDGGKAMVSNLSIESDSVKDVEKWFSSGAEAFAFLRDSDGLMTLWSEDPLVQGRLSIGIRHRTSALVGLTELSVGADVPWQVTDERRASQRTAESLASLAIDSCGLVRGWGWDEDFQQQMSVNEDSLQGLAYWNAYPERWFLDNELLQPFLDAGALIENREDAVVIRLAEWPWEVDVDAYHRLAERLKPSRGPG